MSMNPTYQPLYNQVRNLEFKVKDALDDPTSSAAQALRNELQRLEDEFEMHKTPRALEERVLSIKHMLETPRSTENSYMSVDDAVTFYDDFEDMRRAIRKLPSYQ